MPPETKASKKNPQVGGQPLQYGQGESTQNQRPAGMPDPIVPGNPSHPPGTDQHLQLTVLYVNLPDIRQPSTICDLAKQFSARSHGQSSLALFGLPSSVGSGSAAFLLSTTFSADKRMVTIRKENADGAGVEIASLELKEGRIWFQWLDESLAENDRPLARKAISECILEIQNDSAQPLFYLALKKPEHKDVLPLWVERQKDNELVADLWPEGKEPLWLRGSKDRWAVEMLETEPPMTRFLGPNTERARIQLLPNTVKLVLSVGPPGSAAMFRSQSPKVISLHLCRIIDGIPPIRVLEIVRRSLNP
jgi:hypothetical protein